MNTVKGYEKLVAVYQDAHDQAAKGKGDERHANGQPFHEQRMQQISGLLRSSDGMAFQAIKKLTEGLQFEDHARREAELLGALNYIAGIVIYYRELQDTVVPLRGRGLKPVGPHCVDVKCKVRFVVDKPLTNDQLRAGDWFCRSISEVTRLALLAKGFKSMSQKWPCEMHDYKYSAMGYDSAILLREHDLEIYAYDRLDKGMVLREIIRKGNEFYYV